MEHPEAIGLMSAYFAGTLDRPTVREFHKHINECDRCRAYIRDLGEANRQKSGGSGLYDSRRELERRDPAWRLMRNNRPMPGRRLPGADDQIAANRNLIFKLLAAIVGVLGLLWWMGFFRQ